MPFNVASKFLGGVAFDPATSRLYVSQLSADPVGYDRNPIIHVFQVPGSQILPKRPSVDLDADNSSGANGAGYQTTYREGEAGVSIADDDILIGDPDSTQLAGAEILLQNPQAADSLAVSGTLPTGIVVDPSSTASAVRLSGTASLAAYETALAQVLFENSATDPAIVDRLVSVRVTDLTALRSATATATIKVQLKPPTDAPPIISALGDVTTNEDTATGPLAFTLSDLDTPLNSLTITATSSNQTLVPNANIVLAGSGANRTVNVTPAANASGGPATITLTVSDGTHSVTEKFDVTVKVKPLPDDATKTADLLGRNGNGWYLARSTGNSFVTQEFGNWSRDVTWTNVLTADVNGDGQQDIAGQTANGAWWVGRATDQGFVNEQWGTWSTRVTWQDVQAADVDGDGKDDIVGRANGRWWVARSNGSGFVNELWGSWSTKPTWENVMVADVNGDDRADIVGRIAERWWVAKSTGTAFVNESWGTWPTRTGWQHVSVGRCEWRRPG